MPYRSCTGHARYGRRGFQEGGKGAS